MGVSIWYETPKGREVTITPGWRSMFYSLLTENGLLGELDKENIYALRSLAKTQMKGRNEPPFDYSEEIAVSCRKIIQAIKRHGYVIVCAQH